MGGVLAIVAPVFGIVLLGFAAVRMGWFGARSTRGLVRFVFYFAIPALLLRSLAAMELPDRVPWGFLLSYYGGSLAIFGLGMIAARLLFDRPPADRAIFGMSAGFSNTVLVGLPVLLTALGPEATLPIFLLIALQSPILMPLTVALIQIGKGDAAAIGPRLRSAWRDVMRTPIVTSVLIGLAINLAGLTLPGPLESALGLLGGAAVPCALFAMGASLAGFPLRGDLSAAGLMVFLKLAVHPALVWTLAVLVFGLEGVWVAVAVGMAAMPSGINAYLFAARYDAAEGVAARTVFLSTAASVVTIAAVLALLG